MQNTFASDSLRARLTRIARRWGDDHFDQAAGLVFFEHPKSMHMSGKGAHLLRESSYYAYTLLRTGEENDLRRAEGILERVLPKQNFDEASRYWACFTCEHEQDWATWAHPDQNWAQFLGMIFGYILRLDDEQRRLAAPLRAKLDAAFRLTVLATLRRDVSAAYTNIALLSAAVAAAGATLWRIEGAEAFSLAKLTQVLDRATPTGTFDEYLSPTYYGTDLYALYSVEEFAGTDQARTLAARLLALFWDDIESAYHPLTCQLGGPHSRAYGDNMMEYAAALKYYLFLATGGRYPLNDVETRHSHDCGALSIFCTHRVRRQLDIDTPRPARFRRLGLPLAAGEARKWQSQYADEGFSLGTISEQEVWEQRRNLIAYWRAEPGGRVGVAKSTWTQLGENAKAMQWFSAQAGRGVLAAVRAPVAAEPTAAFSHRLDCNLPAGGETRLDGVEEFLLSLPGMKVEVRPIPLPGIPPARVAIVEGSDGGTALEWRWDRPVPGQAFYAAAFALTFTPDGGAPAVLTDLSARGEENGFQLRAAVGGEPLALRIPALT